MSILTEQMPLTVTVDGIPHGINPGYRIMLEFQEAGDVTAETLRDALLAFYPHGVPVNLQGAIEQFLWFYRCGREAYAQKSGKEDAARERIYSMDYDAEYLYAAFLDQYRVDLQKEPELHWWKFHALFLGLRDDNRFNQIIGYRGTEITPDMSAEQRRRLQKIKDIYKIPLSKEEQEEMDRLMKQLR